MVLEYLFFDKNQRQNVEVYNHELETSDTGNSKNSSVQITYKDFDELECWIVKYERNGNNETTAKQSSEISTYICQEFSPTILTDESSEYFNKSLYPLVNKFERLLRKFLYLKVSQCDEQKFRSVISDIDQKDFGEIYTIATVYKGNIIKNLIMDCQSYTKYRPNETTGGIFVSWRRKEELPTGLD